jgi:tripartite ATP-independent transporter DctM subunit
MTLLVFAFLFIVLTIIGMPIAFVIGVSSTVALIFQGSPLLTIPHLMFDGVDSFLLVAIPMFILLGEIMLRGRLTRTLTDLADIIIGRLRGGLGHVNILASIFFAGITGSAAADITAIGSLLIPSMKERGYSAGYSTAITVSSSMLGPIIPPSLTFILYALAVGNVSIGGLFLAGIIPGLLTGLSLMAIHHVISKKRQYEKREWSYSWSQIITVVKKSIFIMVLPVLIVLGVLSGAFTATEAAAVASAYAIIICLFIFKTLRLSDFPNILMNTAKVNGLLLLFLATSTVFSYVLAIENVPIQVATFLQSLTTNKYAFLIIVNITLIIIGCVIDPFPAIIIFGPILHPIAVNYYGLSSIHFGLVFCFNLLIGNNTPPIGAGLFLGAVVGKVGIESVRFYC